MPFIETSASDGTNVGRAFDTVAAQVLSGMGSRAPVKPLRRSSNSQDFDHSFKVVLLGDEGVGKSCLRWRYARDEFSSDSPVQPPPMHALGLMPLLAVGYNERRVRFEKPCSRRLHDSLSDLGHR